MAPFQKRRRRKESLYGHIRVSRPDFDAPLPGTSMTDRERKIRDHALAFGRRVRSVTPVCLEINVYDLNGEERKFFFQIIQAMGCKEVKPNWWQFS